MKKAILLYFFSLLTFQLHAQIELSPEKFLWFVKNYHPVAQQANLLKSRGENTVLRSKGNFDPYVYALFDNKNFDEKEYFRILNTGLKVPTWYGIELNAGFDQNRGMFVNPQNDIPFGGLWYGGLSITLGQGLFIDNRRAQLKQAKIYAESTAAEQQAILNDLFFNAIQKYWQWVEIYNQYKIYEESVSLASVRFQAVKQSYVLGDNPAVDTLEAFIQLQSRQLGMLQYELLFKNTGVELSNFLWFDNNTPLEVTDSLIPIPYTQIKQEFNYSKDSLLQKINVLNESHPVLKLYDYSLQSFEIERKLRMEALKPTLNINYNFLNEPIGDSYFSGLSTQNYKWGLEFSYPLFIRKQRGDIKLTEIKIYETQIDRSFKSLEIKNKLLEYVNLLDNLERQITLYNSAVSNYNQLLEAEKVKFTLGESSLFLINSRETNYIDAQIKFIELLAKQQIAGIGVVWAFGEFYN
jgi:outer membrane protein TolC